MNEINSINRRIDNKDSLINKQKNTIKTNLNNFESFLNTAKPIKVNKSLDEIFSKASDKYNVDINLLKAIGKAESDFRLDVVSKSGAQGVMQLMPATAKYLGVNDPFDPEQNIMGGSKYIKELLDKYDGDTKLALAAYNAGSNNVAKYGGIPPFKETQNYVKNVMKYMSKDIKTNIEINNSEKYKLVPSEISNDNIFTARAIAMWNKANPIINDEINNI